MQRPRTTNRVPEGEHASIRRPDGTGDLGGFNVTDMKTYIQQAARDFTIREAGRLETQARGMLGQAEEMAGKARDVTGDIQIAINTMVDAKEKSIDAYVALEKQCAELREEIETLVKLARRLEEDKAAGKPFMVEITEVP